MKSNVLHKIFVFSIDLVLFLLFGAIFWILCFAGIVIAFILYRIIYAFVPSIGMTENRGLLIGLIGYFICFGILFYFEVRRWNFAMRIRKFVHSKLKFDKAESEK